MTGTLSLKEKIQRKKAVVAVYGLGYVGLPLLLQTASKGFKTVGVDINNKKVLKLKKGETEVLTSQEKNVFKKLIEEGLVELTSDGNYASDKAEVHIICVPTPVDEVGIPDLKFVVEAAETISKGLREGEIVVSESTSYPGTVDYVIRPVLEKTGLKAGEDFYLAFSPERISPGDPYKISEIPKVVGGVNKESTDLSALFYQQILDAPVIPVSDAKTAEMTKMLENIYRVVNIALINELAVFAEKLGIDIWEVIRAASTKPFGFQSFHPGPGVGGHCVPVDPLYFSFLVRKMGKISHFIELATEINNKMPEHVVELVEAALNSVKKSVKGSTLSIYGLTYKKDVPDLRNTPSKKIIKFLLELGAKIKVYDPYVKKVTLGNETFKSEKNVFECAKGSDCLIFLTDHKMFKSINIEELIEKMKEKIIVDGRNIFDRETCERKGIHYFAIGKPIKKRGRV